MTELLKYTCSWQREGGDTVSTSNFMFCVKKHHLKHNIEKKVKIFRFICSNNNY